MDTSGSMCTSYSTLGSLQKEESDNSILLLIWLHFHINRKSPIMLHENVVGFLSQFIIDVAMQAGYRHAQVKTRPSDVGLCVNRQRKLPSYEIPVLFHIFPLSYQPTIFLANLPGDSTFYQHMQCDVLNVFTLPSPGLISFTEKIPSIQLVISPRLTPTWHLL